MLSQPRPLVPGTFRQTAALSYLLRDEFITDAAAPLVSPRTCEPGPGTDTYTDTDGRLKITGSKLQDDTVGTANAGMVSTASYPRVTGLSYLIDLVQVSAARAHGFGWRDSATLTVYNLMRHGIRGNFSALGDGGNAVAINSVFGSRSGIVLRSAGAWYVDVTNGKLRYVTPTNAQTPVYAQYYSPNSAGVVTADNRTVAQFGGVWATDYGIALDGKPVPVAGDTLAGSADGIVELTWIVESGVTLEIKPRYTDDDNCYVVRIIQAGSTIKVYKREGGVETELTGGTTSQTWTVGTAFRIMVILEGTSIRTFVGVAAKNTATATSFNQAVTTVKATGFTTGYARLFIAWPYDISAVPLVVGSAALVTSYMGYGDSKTSDGSMQTALTEILKLTQRAQYIEGTRIAVTGRTVATTQDNVDSELAAAVGTPSSILINLGANDMGSVLNETNWKNDFLYILDALHVKWPNAQVYIARPWRGGTPSTTPDTVAAWIADLVALRPTFTHLGMDERAFVPSYAADTLHPNAAGYVMSANAWRVVLGL